MGGETPEELNIKRTIGRVKEKYTEFNDPCADRLCTRGTLDKRRRMRTPRSSLSCARQRPSRRALAPARMARRGASEGRALSPVPEAVLTSCRRFRWYIVSIGSCRLGQVDGCRVRTQVRPHRVLPACPRLSASLPLKNLCRALVSSYVCCVCVAGG